MASFVVKPKSSAAGWRLMQQKYSSGKRSEVTVPADAYYALGFSAEMTLEQARARASQLNLLGKVESHSAANAARRVAVDEVRVESAFLPLLLVNAFTIWLENNTNGSPKHIEKLKLQWRVAQRAIADLRIEPSEYNDNSKRIYKHFGAKQFSVSYVNCLLRLMNQWGYYVSKRQGQFFQPIPNPRGQSKQQIAESNESGKFYRAGGSKPLTPQLLESLRGKIAEPCYRWLFVSLWLGLRPYEIEQLGNDTRTVISATEVRVYQSKLVSLPKPMRWKVIPLLEPEQMRAVEFFKAGNLRKPLSKTLKAHLGVEQISAYAGRKGFADLMLSRGHSLVQISMWMGHQSVERTWKNYKQRGVAV